MHSKSTRVLVTGASGFLGRNLIHFLQANGIDNCAVFRPESNLWRYRNFETSSVSAELNDSHFWEDYFLRNRITHIVHLATYGSYPDQTDTQKTIATNLFSSLSFTQIAMQSKNLVTFISAGSGSEYDPLKGVSSENDIGKSANIYGATKTAYGLVASRMAEDYGKNFAHLRLFTMYGPWEQPTRIIPRLLVHASNGTLPPLSDAKNARDYVYVNDVLTLFLKMITKNDSFNTTVNVGSGISTTLGSLVKDVKEIYNLSVNPQWGVFPSRTFDQKEWTCTVNLAEEIFGWHALTSIKQGLLHYSEWLSGNKLNNYIIES